jgi:hypothetical protein
MKTIQQQETEAILAMGAEIAKLKDEVRLLTTIIRDQSMEIDRLTDIEWKYRELQ